MNRKEFFEKLIDLYEDFTEKNIKPRTRAYCAVLDENIDYDLLYKFMLQEHNSFRIAPSPAFLFGLLPKINEYKRLKEGKYNAYI